MGGQGSHRPFSAIFGTAVFQTVLLLQIDVGFDFLGMLNLELDNPSPGSENVEGSCLSNKRCNSGLNVSRDFESGKIWLPFQEMRRS